MRTLPVRDEARAGHSLERPLPRVSSRVLADREHELGASLILGTTSTPRLGRRQREWCSGRGRRGRVISSKRKASIRPESQRAIAEGRGSSWQRLGNGRLVPDWACRLAQSVGAAGSGFLRSAANALWMTSQGVSGGFVHDGACDALGLARRHPTRGVLPPVASAATRAIEIRAVDDPHGFIIHRGRREAQRDERSSAQATDRAPGPRGRIVVAHRSIVVRAVAACRCSSAPSVH